MWLYGRHAALAAAANPRRILLRAVALTATAAVLERACRRSGVPRPAIEVLDRQALDRLLPLATVHQGVAVQARRLEPPSLEELLAMIRSREDALVVILDQVADPRNVGAVLRSAAAFAATAVLVQDRHAPLETGALAKSASGALEVVPMVPVVNVARALRSLRGAGVRCIGLASRARLSLAEAPLTGRLALVIGAEEAGLRRLVSEACDVVVGIPIAPPLDSLNLSVAAGLALYACRQAQLWQPPRVEV